MNPHFDCARCTLSRRELIALATTLATAGCADTRSSNRHAKTAPIDYDEHGGLMIEARVESAEIVRMILDTGASRSALDSAFVRRLGLPLRNGGEVEGSAGVVRAQETEIDLEIAPIAGVASPGRSRLSCTVYDIGSYDPRCVGILGGDFLSRSPFQIFYRERKWSWGDAPIGARVPMRLDNGIPRIRVTIDSTPLELRIDTGATFPPGADAYLNVTVAQAQALRLTGPPRAVFTATGTGGGDVEPRRAQARLARDRRATHRARVRHRAAARRLLRARGVGRIPRQRGHRQARSGVRLRERRLHDWRMTAPPIASHTARARDRSPSKQNRGPAARARTSAGL